MTFRITVVAGLLILLTWGTVFAAESAAPADKPQAVFLWSDGAPGAKGNSLEDKPRITPYLVPGDGPNACVVVCPGGGYGGRAAHEGEPVARWLNTLGISGVVLDYRVAPYRHPIPLGDAQRAIRFVRAKAAEWRIDPKRVGILGFSAGGHLAASASTIFDAGNPDATDPIDRRSCRPDATVLCYPVITFGEFRHHCSMVNLLGNDPDPKLRESLSLETRVTPQTPPTFLWHTSDDSGVPVENSLLYAMALRKNKVPFALHVFPHGPHGIGLAANVPEARQWPTLCAEWLKGLGFTGK
ncbi:MAG TPA: alpha/beta hydrolase [Phycisphaerae bacterium]|nr:alpha/beta hydrolase [Phycisphaerae bacterium]